MKETKHTYCTVEGCAGKGVKTGVGQSFPKGLCVMHYQRLKKHGDIHYQPEHHTCCKVPGCTGRGKIRKGLTDSGEPYGEVFINGYCQMHNKRFISHGDPLTLKVSSPGNDIKNNPLYTIWADIRTRCTNANRPCYKNYGGRGIKMCPTWQGPGGFLKFAADVGERPSKDYSIDRIDNNGHYEPGNIKWSTRHEQTANQRTNNEHLGISWYRPTEKWMARIKVNKKQYFLGYYEILDDAIAARKAAELKHGITYSNPKP